MALDENKKNANNETPSGDSVPLPSSGRANVRYRKEPPSQPEDKKIQPRRPLPIVPDRNPEDR